MSVLQIPLGAAAQAQSSRQHVCGTCAATVKVQITVHHVLIQYMDTRDTHTQFGAKVYHRYTAKVHNLTQNRVTQVFQRNRKLSVNKV